VTPHTCRQAAAADHSSSTSTGGRRPRPALAARAAAAALVAGALGLGAVHPALAHDVHPFGPLTVALGWVNEPAYVGFDNGVQVIVKQGTTPVADITDKDLTVEVSLDKQKMDAKPLVPTSDPATGLGTPGEYEMHFIPTAPGNYTFHIKGAVKGTPVDETVTSSDKTFEPVTDASDVQFPNKLPNSNDLSTKIDKVSSRVGALEGQVIPGLAGIFIGLSARRRSSEI
jgi:hypothetical protein